MLCPKCKVDLKEGKADCPICGWESANDKEHDWVVIGTIEERPFADLARETLKSMDIPAIVVSNAGFFGNIGLPLNSIFDGGKLGLFEVSAPRAFVKEASEALDMTLGDKWKKEAS